jgi:hypothetical protein
MLELVLKFLKIRLENEKSKIMYEELLKNEIKIKDRSGQERIVNFTNELKENYIRKNIHPNILKKIMKGEI